MFRSRFNLGTFASLLFLAACGGGKSPSDSPANISATAGDSRAIIRWDQQSDLNYWIFRARAPLITRDDYSKFPEAHIDAPVNSPRAVTGLTNDETYSFVMNATKGNGPAGPSSSSISAVPRLAGETWTVLPVLDGAANANDVIFSTDKFYVVGNNATIFEGIETLDATDNTKNKITWTKRAAPTGITQDLYGLVFNSGATRFVAVGAGGKVLISSDAITWSATDISSSATPKLNSVAFGIGVYVAVGDTGAIYSSSDAATWVERTSVTGENLNDVAFLSGRFVTVGANGFIATSTDGVTWTQRTSPSTQGLNASAFGSNKFIVVGNGGTTLTSTDGETWTAATSLTPAPTQNLYDVYFGSRFIAVGAGGVIVPFTVSTAGDLTWLVIASGTSDLFATAYGLGANVAAGSAGANSYSF